MDRCILARAGALAGVIALSGTVHAQCDPDTVTFSGPANGTIITQINSAGGYGPIAVQGVNPGFSSLRAAMIFDSANPSVADPDLGTPNEFFGGPGVGADGGPGPFANNTAQGNLLIITQDLNSNIPNDHSDGGLLIFTFPTEVEVFSVYSLDVESDRLPVVEFFNGATSLGTDTLTQSGSNGAAINDLGQVPAVTKIVFDFDGSGAIDDLRFREWNDCNENGTNDCVDIANGTSMDTNGNGMPDECEECFLVFGTGSGTAPINPLGIPLFSQLDQVTEYYPVLLNDMPEFVISPPNPMTTNPFGPSLVNRYPEPFAPHVFTLQVLMWNPGVFPAHPMQYTQGLRVYVLPDGRLLHRYFGDRDSMDVWAETRLNHIGQTVIRFPFSIDGL
jgi:hypothetical protein